MGKGIAKKIFSLQNIGMFLALAACVVFWLPIWKYSEVHGFWVFKKIEEKSLDLKPGLISGIFSFVLLGILYLRGILRFPNHWLGVLSFLINLTLFATVIEVFISPGSVSAKTNPLFQNVGLIIACAVCAAVLIFGVKEIAKIILLIFFLGFFYLNLKLVNDAMGVWGYLNLVIVFVSFFLQQNISVNGLGGEFRYLFGGIKKQELLAQRDLNRISSTSKGLTEDRVKALIDERLASKKIY
ncbi:MAG: hypothetical protein ACTTHG_02740 [Treponemataceae bacterium]